LKKCGVFHQEFLKSSYDFILSSIIFSDVSGEIFLFNGTYCTFLFFKFAFKNELLCSGSILLIILAKALILHCGILVGSAKIIFDFLFTWSQARLASSILFISSSDAQYLSGKKSL